MHFPPFWRGRGPHVTAGNRTARLQAVISAARSVPLYRDKLLAAHLSTDEQIHGVLSQDEAIRRLPFIEQLQYLSAFQAVLQPAFPEGSLDGAAHRGIRAVYTDARTGLKNSAGSSNVYSLRSTGRASGDLWRLANSLDNTPAMVPDSEALVVFSGMEAGLLVELQRDELWQLYGIPIFEQFIDPAGDVIAAECEVHAGLHIRVDDAIFESVDGELIVTSLTNRTAPMLRVRTGIAGVIETECCDCGREEPRLSGLCHLDSQRSTSAVA